MSQNFHVTRLTSSKPKEPSNCSTILQLAERLALAAAVVPGAVALEKSELDDGRPAKVNKVSSSSGWDIAARTGIADPGTVAISGESTSTVVPKKVIVVGAGIAGLRAASVLRTHGVDVVVLEGRPDRIGGRILTSRKPGKAVRDIGAAWMHETAQNKLVGLVRKLDIEHYYDDGTPLYYTRDGKAGAQFKAKKVADEFADYLEWYYEENPDAEDKSVADSIKDWIEEHQLLTDEERKWAPQAVREVEAWIGTSIEQASSKHLSYFITERNLYMKGGYDSVVNWTASNLHDPNVIRLGQTVKEIEWTDGASKDGKDAVAVHVETPVGTLQTHTAHAVICTVPLGVLHHDMIKFSPQLPDDMKAGLGKVSYGALGKVFFEFETVFWSKDNDQFIYYPSPTTGPIDENSVFSYMTITSNAWIMNGTKELSVQIAEPLTQRVEAMSDTQVYAFFEPLFRLLRSEPHKDLPRLVSLESTHWTQDPFAGYGTYTADKTGDEPELWPAAVAAHKDSALQFAGEHCTLIGNGCVHGAFATGESAAMNVLKNLGIAHNGGDPFSVFAKRSPRGSRK